MDVQKLRELAKLRDEGILSESEFLSQKESLLGGSKGASPRNEPGNGREEATGRVVAPKARFNMAAINNKLGYAATAYIASMFLPWYGRGVLSVSGWGIGDASRMLGGGLYLVYAVPLVAGFVGYALLNEKEIPKLVRFGGFAPVVMTLSIFLKLKQAAGQFGGGDFGNVVEDLAGEILKNMGAGYWLALLSGIALFIFSSPPESLLSDETSADQEKEGKEETEVAAAAAENGREEATGRVVAPKARFKMAAINNKLGYAATAYIASMFLPWYGRGVLSVSGWGIGDASRMLGGGLYLVYSVPLVAGFVGYALLTEKQIPKLVRFGGFAPVVMTLSIFWKLKQAAGQFGGGDFGNVVEELAGEILKNMGAGYWLALLSGIALFIFSSPPESLLSDETSADQEKEKEKVALAAAAASIAPAQKSNKGMLIGFAAVFFLVVLGGGFIFIKIQSDAEAERIAFEDAAKAEEGREKKAAEERELLMKQIEELKVAKEREAQRALAPSRQESLKPAGIATVGGTANPHMVLACSMKKGSSNALERAHNKIAQISAAGFPTGQVVDTDNASMPWRNFTAGYYSCVIASYGTRDEAIQLSRGMKAAGLSAYVKKGKL